MAQTQSQSSQPTLPGYQTEGFFDELVTQAGVPRKGAEQLVGLINQIPPAELLRRQHAIERSLYQMGITFTVYSDSAGTEKIMPFDIVPRIISCGVVEAYRSWTEAADQGAECFSGRHLFDTTNRQGWHHSA